MKFPRSLETLLNELEYLPTVGPKTAARLAFHILEAPSSRVQALAQAIIDVKEKLQKCTRCGNLAEGELCEICRDGRRNEQTICVVANARDLMAMESSGEYKGLYHVLGGLISPLDGVGPEQLNLASLFNRVKNENVKELIIATNPTIQGEATALYIKKILKSGKEILITRLASGLPMGANLEYSDPLTLSRAICNRVPMH
ncbi:recombination protein RecR [bacterium]|nr:recombination protein RecR [bacterium]